MNSERERKTIGWVFFCCWITYLTAYLCRVNFSSAMHTIHMERGFSTDMLGGIGAVFYGVYACGQLVNGYIGDRVRADWFILLALAGTMMANIGMAFAPSFAAMLVLWGINGCFQSMFWSTIIRVLAQSIPEDKRAAISSGISLAMPSGYIVSWGLLGYFLEQSSAQWFFLLPALGCLIPICAWLFLSRRIEFAAASEKRTQRSFMDTVRFMRSEKLFWTVIICLFHGLLKEGAAYWIPLLTSDAHFAIGMSPYLAVLLLPLANVLGILAARFCLKREGERPYHILVFFFTCIAVFSMVLTRIHDGLIKIAVIALISGFCSANNNVLMGFLPMAYARQNKVSSVVGVFDFASYIGAAISTYALGKALNHLGFEPLPFIWLSACAAALLIAAVILKKVKNG